MMKKVCVILLIWSVVISCFGIYITADTNFTDDNPEGDGTVSTGGQPDLGLDAKSAILLEESTGTVLYNMNGEEALPPASVTKVMTLLLIWEAIEQGNIHLQDKVTISAYAASMGGSQVFLEEGEEMSVEDLIKCTAIASANDAAVALAEYVMGSETAFVEKMNMRAAELGMKSAHFENVTGLDDDTVNHVISAMDIAIASRELIRHKEILQYTSVWMDTIRDGTFTLTNTNRLIRYYNGATGLKTGSTEKAKFCVTVTAMRDGMSLIAVIMGAPSRDVRNSCAKTLLDWGFSNYCLYTDPETVTDDVPIVRGETDSVPTKKETFSMVINRSDLPYVEKEISMQPTVSAPIQKGDVSGTVTYKINGQICGTACIKATRSVDEITFWSVFVKMLKIYTLS